MHGSLFQSKWRLLKTNPCISKEGSPRHSRARAAVVTGTGAGLLLCPAAGLAATPLVWAQATLWGHTESCSLFSARLRERWCSKDGRSRNEQLRVSLAPLVYFVPEKASLMPGFWRQCFIACVYLSISLFSRLPHDTVMLLKKKKRQQSQQQPNKKTSTLTPVKHPEVFLFAFRNCESQEFCVHVQGMSLVTAGS